MNPLISAMALMGFGPGVDPLGNKRSPQWAAVRNAFIKLNPECAVCGGKHDLDCHHCRPFHLFPALELSPSNLITLCTPHHLLVGHLMNWASWNNKVREDAGWFRDKINHRPGKAA